MVAANDTEHPANSHHLKVKDVIAGRIFSMDNSGGISAIPGDPNNLSGKQTEKLQAANGAFGHCSLTLAVCLNFKFRWVFTVTDITQNIIGIDPLQHFNPLIDIGHKKVAERQTPLNVTGCRQINTIQ